MSAVAGLAVCGTVRAMVVAEESAGPGDRSPGSFVSGLRGGGLEAVLEAAFVNDPLGAYRLATVGGIAALPRQPPQRAAAGTTPAPPGAGPYAHGMAVAAPRGTPSGAMEGRAAARVSGSPADSPGAATATARRSLTAMATPEPSGWGSVLTALAIVAYLGLKRRRALTGWVSA
ncbi:hypothetical protein OOT46_15565 [Aquabacterium sp. A7-Y]|uniref:hypothetical protein n=1 Tax=Aquabacterium sp. A7-Y TaxID=1349605 RepID=UPI00223DAB75|nr:hypothetical protein [Aquabacterium sp. A7-Y]MCW7539262.1 hypothetical protein [Aquabacterium sp. A7-Y]